MANISSLKHLPEGKRSEVVYGRHQIKINRAKCLVCNDVIVSAHTHDFVSCKCGNLSVDGGQEYLKRCFIKFDSWEELSEYRR